jgi:hypothetical protein
VTVATEPWSYTDLRKRYGEDAALAMLQHMPGTGQYEGTFNDTHKPRKDGVDRCPLCGNAMSSTARCGQ